MAFPELVDALVADTKLEKDQVGAWTSSLQLKSVDNKRFSGEAVVLADPT